jgi:predicted hydrocarbon binding protein
MENSGSFYFYPNRMGRIIFLALEEILGQSGVNVILNLAELSEFIGHYPPNNSNRDFSFQTISRLQAALEEFYGPHGGRGVALRVGRACFQYGLREHGSLPGLTDLAFRLMPLQTRLKVGANALAEIFNQQTDQRVRLEDKDGVIFWQIERCPFCWNRQTEGVACQLSVGLLQEAVYWISGGKYFSIDEISCVANGASTCTIAIHKTPLS